MASSDPAPSEQLIEACCFSLDEPWNSMSGNFSPLTNRCVLEDAEVVGSVDKPLKHSITQ